MKVTIDVDVDIPEGFEAVRYGTANPGEYFLYRGDAVKAECTALDCIVLKKKEIIYTLEELKPGDVFVFADKATYEWYPYEYTKCFNDAYHIGFAFSTLFRNGDTVHMINSGTRVKKIDRD